MSRRALAVTIAAAGLSFAAVAPLAPLAASTTPRQLTGTQLASALLPASYFPAGYKVDHSNDYNSGSRLERGPARYNIARISCKTFNNAVGKKGFGESAIATDFFAQSEGNSFRLDAFGQLVYQFRAPGMATEFFRALPRVFARCPDSAGARLRISRAAPVDGHQAFQISVATSVPVKSSETLLVSAAGPDLFVTAQISLNEPAPSSPTARTLLARLIPHVLAFR
jgi:hypothetical protein